VVSMLVFGNIATTDTNAAKRNVDTGASDWPLVVVCGSS
jgi:hypothetical protein